MGNASSAISALTRVLYTPFSVLQGDSAGAAATYRCASAYAASCLLTTGGAQPTADVVVVNSTELSLLLAGQAHNIDNLGHSLTTQTPEETSGRATFFVPKLGFEVLESIVRTRLQAVEDMDAQLRTLGTLKQIDDVMLVAEGNRQLEVAEAELTRDDAAMAEAGRVAGLLTQEMGILQSKYDEYWADLKTNLQGAMKMERLKMQQLDAEVKKLEDAKKRKSFWGAIKSAFETIGGIIACALGAPELGVPLILDGVDSAVTAATNALGPPPADEDKDKQLHQTCVDTIENVKKLKEQAVVMSGLIHSLSTGTWQKATLAKELPFLTALDLDQSTFSQYMSAFALNLAATAGAQTSAALTSSVSQMSSTVQMMVKTLKAYYSAHMDQQHGELQHKLHAVRVTQLKDVLTSTAAAEAARSHVRDMVQAKRDKHALSALRAIAMQRRRFVDFALADPETAAAQMPSVWVDPPSSLAAASASAAATVVPLDTSKLLASAVSNYIFILRSQAARPSQQSPESCFVSYTVNATSHPQALNDLQGSGTLRLLFSPSGSQPSVPSSSSSGSGSGSGTGAAAAAWRFAYDASVQEMHVFVDLAETNADGTPSTVSLPAKTRVRIVKSGTDVRLASDATARRYMTEPNAFEYVYETDSECPLSSSSGASAGGQTTLLSSSGTSPSMYGAWNVAPALSAEQLAKVVRVRILLRVDHKVGSNRYGGVGSNNAGTTAQMLFGGARPSDGSCGAVHEKCQFVLTQGGSAEGCNAGFSAAARKKKTVTNSGVWLGVVVGMAVALCVTLVLAVWTGWRLVLHNKEAERQRQFFDKDTRHRAKSMERNLLP